MNEITVIHPLVKERLEFLGYPYIHEYKLPDYGRVDFYATHPSGRPILIEAKIHNSTRVITQLAGYGVQIPEAKLIIAIPKREITSQIEGLTEKYNIGIMGLWTPFYTRGLDGLKQSFINQLQTLINQYISNPDIMVNYFGEKPPTLEQCQAKFNRELLFLCKEYRKWLFALEMVDESINAMIGYHATEADWGIDLSRKHFTAWLNSNLQGVQKDFFAPAKIIRIWAKKKGGK